MTAQHALAALIDGDPQPSGAIITNLATITASITGEVRANGHPIGTWSDEPEALAAAYRAAVAS